jgi:choline dehydrogenase-like flavoprotein
MLGGKEATARLRADSTVNPGDRASLMVDMGKAVLFDPASETGSDMASTSGATTDILIVGSGIGGATLAAGLAESGAEVTILERGEQLADSPATRDTRAIFVEGRFRPEETWQDAQGAAFNPGNYYYVGGNSKFYGAVMLRYRVRDFEVLEHADGTSPAWPFAYDVLEPWYAQAEELFEVRGAAGEDPTEPPRSAAYPHRPVPDEPAIAAVRERLSGVGMRPFSLPLAVDIERWLKRAATPWDAYPDTRSGKYDAETASLARALQSPTVSLVTGAEVERLIVAPDGKRIEGVEYSRGGERRRLRASVVVVSAGAVNSAALLLRSATEACPGGVANRSGVVGRHFMNHNCTAMLTGRPAPAERRGLPEDARHQRLLPRRRRRRPAARQRQLLGKVTGPILKANLRWGPGPALSWLASHSVDWYLMSEDLPDPDSRVRVDGRSIHLDWRRTNMTAHGRLVARMREVFRGAGYPLVLARPFDRRTPSHQCGTVRLGADPESSALDPFCRAHDHPNLFVVDAAFMPSSAAVNPALTIAAQALRVADHLVSTRLAA